MLATLSNPGDFVKFTQESPYHYVTKLVSYNEDISGAGTLKREFRWSVTNKVRASWMDLTDEILQKIILNPNNELFVDYRYTLVGGGPITINDINLVYEQDPDADDKFWGYCPPLLVSERGNISNLTKIENFTFRPYQVNPAIALYKELSMTINKMFGHDVQYARTVPMAIGKDFTLHEWTLYDVDDPCCIKVLVPDNEFPDSKIEFNPMGLDFEMPFEIHIDKAYFEQTFGIGTGPQKRDIIYFPLTNRIFEIESSYLWKDIMQREVYWKVNLKKYAPKSNRYEPQDLREQFDSITWDSEERFGEEVRQDEIKVTKPQQYDPKIGSRQYDPIRETVNENLIISELNVKNYNITLSESQYDLRSIFNPKEKVNAVTYKANSVFPASTDEERLLMGWFQPLPSKVTILKDTVRGQIAKGTTTSTTTQLSFVLNVKRNYTTNDLIKITRFNGLSLYGKFVSTTPVAGGHVYTIEVNNDIIKFLDVFYSNWASASVTSGYSAELTHESSLLNGYDEVSESGWKVSIFANRYVVLKSSVEEHIFILQNNLIENSWYGFALNVNNFYQQISLDLWIRKWSETEMAPQQTTNLENIYSKTIIAQPVDRTANDGNYAYNLDACNLAYTNIRLFKKTETDLMKQMIMLNQAIVQDSQFAIIVDNAVPRLMLPWIGKTK
jgi:hypothetical protein